MRLDGQTEVSHETMSSITSITWLTNTALSGARLYWENKFPISASRAWLSRLL